MTEEEIIEMARQAGFEDHQAKFDTRFEPFAKLVAQRTWVGLTGEEIENAYIRTKDFVDMARVLEDILKEKNT